MTIIDNSSTTQHIPNSIIASIGMFDGVHLGHATILNHIVEQANRLHLEPAVITFRQHPQSVLNPDSSLRMILTLEDRLQLIESFGIKTVFLFDFTPQLAALTAAQFMRQLHDDYGVSHLVVGFNHHFGHDKSLGFQQYVEQGRHIGVTVLQAPEYRGKFAPVSSSIIREQILSGQISEANLRLGRPFSISGVVVHGFENGRKMGFSTANVGQIHPTLIMPHNGVYAAYATVNGNTHMAMVNIGKRPTLHNGDQISVEANLFNFSGDIYDQPISVTFIRFLRNEVPFSDLDALKEQLAADRLQVTEILSNTTIL